VLIFQGTAAEILTSPIVQAAYLGDPSVEEAAVPAPSGGEAVTR
jgi:hypothetical protein